MLFIKSIPLMVILTFHTLYAKEDSEINYCFQTPYIFLNGKSHERLVQISLQDIGEEYNEGNLSKIFYEIEDNVVNSFELICHKEKGLYSCNVDITDGGYLKFNLKYKTMTMEYISTSTVYMMNSDDNTIYGNPDEYEFDILDVKFPKEREYLAKKGYKMWVTGHVCSEEEEAVFDKERKKKD